MPNTSFIKRKLQIRLIDNLAMKASVEKLGPPDFSKASVEIYGMPLDEMAQLTSLSSWPLKTSRNYINIYAGDDVQGMSEIFAGSIVSANADYSGCPEHKLVIDAEVGFWGRVMPQGPGVINGTMSLASFVKKQADAAGMTFSNEGVNATLKNCVFSGSPVNQARQAAEQMGVDLLIDDDEMVLIPRQGARSCLLPTAGCWASQPLPVMASNASLSLTRPLDSPGYLFWKQWFQKPKVPGDASSSTIP